MTAGTHRISIRSIEDAVVVIAAYTTRAIADTNPAPGHDRETVGARMTSDRVLNTIRAAYTHRIHAGDTPREAVIAVGTRLVTEYCNHHGI